MNLTLLTGQIVTGLASGAGYAIVAIGLSYTLGLARVMNFAFGTFYMLTAFACVAIMAWLGLDYVSASALAVLLLAALGFAFSRLVVLPAMKVSEPAVMIATLGVGAALTSLAQLRFGAEVTFVASPFAETSYRLGFATVSQQTIILIVAAPLLTCGLSVLMKRTLLGQRIRAVADAPTLASASGMKAPGIQALAAAIGIVLAAVAAVLASPTGVISVFMGEEVLLKAFAIAALAGIGRLGGALAVGFAVGVFEAVVSGMITTAYSTTAIYGLLIVTLIFFPRGLFGGH